MIYGLSQVDIELPEDLPLKEAHAIGESLQIKIEELPEVERAFVHLDFECDHKPEHSILSKLPSSQPWSERILRGRLSCRICCKVLGVLCCVTKTKSSISSVVVSFRSGASKTTRDAGAEGRDCNECGTPCGSVGLVVVLSEIRHFAVGIIAVCYGLWWCLDQRLGERE